MLGEVVGKEQAEKRESAQSVLLLPLGISEVLREPTYLGSSTSCRRYRNERPESFRDGETFSDGGVDEIEKIRFGVGCEEVRDLASVYLNSAERMVMRQ